jgi:hypothetical protein
VLYQIGLRPHSSVWYSIHMRTKSEIASQRTDDSRNYAAGEEIHAGRRGLQDPAGRRQGRKLFLDPVGRPEVYDANLVITLPRRWKEHLYDIALYRDCSVSDLVRDDLVMLIAHYRDVINLSPSACRFRNSDEPLPSRSARALAAVTELVNQVNQDHARRLSPSGECSRRYRRKLPPVEDPLAM